ncbi:hypothetical protein DOY81_007128 [Sarcophaga bullata]|nr:hypothetical protein DOY81_007128 [Sarcophaga bullata]
MKHLKYFVVSSLLVMVLGSSPIEEIVEEEEENWQDDPELTAGFIEGDMEIDDLALYNGMTDTTKRWPNGVVRYKLGNVFDLNHVIHIIKAMQTIESVSCIRFYPAADTAKAYVRINSANNGCSATVGYTGTKQNINLKISPLGQGCFRSGSIIHEILHTLGFFHQHRAHNRDQFIRINWNNIMVGKENAFTKYNPQTSTDFGIGYDYGSVLHYGPKVFSKNGRNTIVPLKALGENVVMGQRRALVLAGTYTYAKSYADADDNLDYFENEDPELTAGFFEGDMDIVLTRNGLKAASKRWPKGVVRYKIDKIFDEDHVDYIEEAMEEIEAASCIRFEPAFSTTKAYIQFTGKPSGCHAYVGYSGRKQYVNLKISPLDVGCFKKGTIIHEILHALGFHHQQSAPDRDNYVTIIKNNIAPGHEHNFQKYSWNLVTGFGVEYDYDSVMHYGSTVFSKNGKETIVPRKGNDIEIGQRNGLSAKDIKKLNLMYKCSRRRNLRL